MPNVQIPLEGLTSEQKLACAILCCDKKEYDFDTPRDKSLSCTRMGSRKHSCVTHTLRARDDQGRLKSPPEDRYDDVHIPNQKGQPYTDLRAGIKPEDKILKIAPDCLVKKSDGWHAIDAKFPCDLDQINKKIGTRGTQTKSAKNVQSLSTNDTGASRASFKEDVAYLDYEKDGGKVKSSTCMSPQDARDMQAKPKQDGGGFECKCDDINKL